MRRKFRRLDLYEIGFYVLHDSIPRFRRQQIDQGRMDRRGRSKRPSIQPVALHHLYNVLRELLANTTIVFQFHILTFGDRVRMSSAPAVADRKPAGLVSEFGVVAPVRIGNIEGLNQTQTRTAVRRLIYFVGFEAAAISENY